MLYDLARAGLFRLDAEHAHELTLAVLSHAPRAAGLVYGQRLSAPKKLMGLTFPNPVGLAAGLDKDARCIEAWDRMGFGFIEVGTVTPRAQPGNPKPRLFRLPEHEALINRMGFNNDGVEALVRRVQRARRRKPKAIIGINLGKNFDTPNERAAEDYRKGLEAVHAVADYVTVNISSPNTKGLRDLQSVEALRNLLKTLNTTRERLADAQGRKAPMALKIAPDLSAEALQDMAGVLLDSGIDAVIATNTTLSRAGVEAHARADEAGGLSGKPVADRSTEVVARLSRLLDGALPIIGVGGIMRGADARAKIEAGASLVQIYTGFIYRGPDLVAECVQALA